MTDKVFSFKTDYPLKFYYMIHVNYDVHEQNILTQSRGFNLNNFEELRSLVFERVRHTIKRYHPNHSMPVDDIAWDCFTKLWERNFFAKYDMRLSAKATYLWNGVKNYLIDCERVASTKPRGMSLDVPISSKGETTYGQMLDEKMCDATIGIEAYFEILNLINPKLGGSKVKSRIERFAVLDNGLELELSGYAVLYLTLSGYKNKEIAEKFKVSAYYISQLYNRGFNELKEVLDLNDLDSRDITDCISVSIASNDVCECPHCCSRNTRFWSDETVSAIPFYICKDCERAFSEFTGTPIQKFNTKNKLKFIETGYALLEGCTVGEVSVKVDISVDLVRQWSEMFQGYFEGEPEILIKMKLFKWKHILVDAVERKSNWGV